MTNPVRLVPLTDLGLRAKVDNNGVILGFVDEHGTAVQLAVADANGQIGTVNGAPTSAGEFQTTFVAIGNAVAITTATPKDMCTLALTAGDWDVSGTVYHNLTGCTATQRGQGISLVADTPAPAAAAGGLGNDAMVAQAATFGTAITGVWMGLVGPVRVSLAAPATVHLVVADTFSAGTVAAYGSLRARRAGNV